MKKLKESLAAKIAALVLAVVFSAVCVFTIIGVAYCADKHLYDVDFENSVIVSAEAENLTYSLARHYTRNTLGQSTIELLTFGNKLLIEFSVNGEKYYENHDFTDETRLWRGFGYEYQHEDGHKDLFELKYLVNYDSAQWKNDFGFIFYHIFVPLGLPGGVVLGILFGVIWLALLIFYISSAGYKKGKEGIFVCDLNRIPFDLLIGLYLAAFIGAAYLIDWTGLTDNWGYPSAIAHILVISLFCGIAEIAVLLLFSSIAVRIKAKTFWKNTIIYRVLKLLWRGLCAVGRGLRSAYRSLPMLWKTILVLVGFAAIGFILFLFAATGAWGIALVLAVLLFLAFCVAACMISLQMQKLRAAGTRLAAGDLEYKTDTKRLFWDFRRHAEDLNAVSDVLGTEVEQRIKSERMKTELITNVSHDIKTPLTSIINYVDLLKKPHTDEEEQAYLEVLDRQSRRMKKLMEDLVEASKASTGNINVDLAPMDVCELLHQAVSEYEERFGIAGLTPVLQISAEKLMILADGKLLWRVMDNLLENICKYA
ncbi:MAG: HAMP domain-containing histidine kinase, partial [Christensenellaceae bacterium]|nr:HAMP domain-containing histidine kinase [Christensenellaceae bacterium]